MNRPTTRKPDTVDSVVPWNNTLDQGIKRIVLTMHVTDSTRGAFRTLLYPQVPLPTVRSATT